MKIFIPALLPSLLLVACTLKTDDPPGTYKNEKFGFSIVAPAGWTKVTAETAADFLKQHGDRVLSSTADVFRTPVSGRNTWVVAWVKTDSKEPKAPVLWVLHNAVGLPQVGPAELQKSRAAIQAKCTRSNWAGYTEVGAKLSDLDGMKAIDIGYSGTFENTALRVWEAMIPAKNMTHFVALSAPNKDLEALGRVYSDTLNSFHSFGQR